LVLTSTKSKFVSPAMAAEETTFTFSAETFTFPKSPVRLIPFSAMARAVSPRATKTGASPPSYRAAAKPSPTAPHPISMIFMTAFPFCRSPAPAVHPGRPAGGPVFFLHCIPFALRRQDGPRLRRAADKNFTKRLTGRRLCGIIQKI
jgi:hypothetical protein